MLSCLERDWSDLATISASVQRRCADSWTSTATDQLMCTRSACAHGGFAGLVPTCFLKVELRAGCLSAQVLSISRSSVCC